MEPPLYSPHHEFLELRKTKSFSLQFTVRKIKFLFIKLLNFYLKLITLHLKRRGILVFIWVLNSKEEFQIAKDVNLLFDLANDVQSGM